VPLDHSREAHLDLTPALVLAMWAAGLSGAVAAVAWWRVVGPGYVWLGAGVTLLFGIPALAAGAGEAAAAGCVLAAAGLASGRDRRVATPALAGASIAFCVAAALEGPVLGAISGAVLLGGVTGEMMLGHWFLVDPRLPRWALRRLDLAGGLGALLDLAVLLGLGVFPWEEGDLVVALGFLLLSVTTMALMAMVWAALGEEGYSAVMAATGLSYLATLTAIGAAVVGRLLLAGPVLGVV
jgi:hypothetical protein